MRYFYLIPFLLLSHCVTYIVPVQPTQPVDLTQGYIIGQFILMGDYRSDQNAGIILNGDGCSSMKSCTLPFRGNHESFYAIAVPPGNYQIDSFVLNAGGFQTKYVTFSDKIKTTLKFETPTFKVEPGKAIYIGSFVALASYSQGIDRTTSSIQLIGAKDDFKNAGIRFSFFNPQFNGFQVVSAFD